MTINKIIDELKCFYTMKEISELSKISVKTLDRVYRGNLCSELTRSKLLEFFDIHVSNYSEELTIPELQSSNAKYLIESPDGWLVIKKYFNKPLSKCYKVEVGGMNVECSDIHLLQREDNTWEMTKSLEVGDKLITKDGSQPITSISEIESQLVYDLEVQHTNHRYWSGGLSSHNCGKTFFVQKIIANAQKMGKHVVVFDSENAIDAEGARGFGIDPRKVKYVPTTTIENTRNAIKQFLEKVAQSGTMGKFVIIVDSLAQMESELGEKRMSNDNNAADMGTFAKSIKSFLKTCVNWGKITKTTIVITNEVYDDPSAMYPSLEKNMPGGRAAIYKPSVTVQLARKPLKADDKDSLDNKLAAAQKSFSGVVLRCLTVKNRFVKQFLEVELYLSFAKGLHRTWGLLEVMRGLGVVVLDGKTYKDWNGESLGYYKTWRENDEVWDRLLIEAENRIQTEWTYSNEDLPDDLIEDDEDDDTDEVEESSSPLDKLKEIKKKVSKKIDKIEEETSDAE